jgi:iron complex outermembrane receptor protein
MADFNTRLAGYRLRGNAGVRYVQTKQSATGYLATGGGTPVTVEQTYSDVLPSFNLATDLSQGPGAARVAAAKVMSRPQLGFLNPGGTISTTGTLSITTGNPLLKPFRAKTFDTSLEWYHDRNALGRPGPVPEEHQHLHPEPAPEPAVQGHRAAAVAAAANFTGDEVFQVTYPVNTDGGKLQGFEINVQQPFSFLPGAGKNLGVLLNYTQVKSKIAYQVSPTSGHDHHRRSAEPVAEVVERHAVLRRRQVQRARVGLQPQRLPDPRARPEQQRRRRQEQQLNVDLSISYKLNDQIEFTFEG